MSAFRRVAVAVPSHRLEEARAVFVDLFPAGFEDAEGELAAYTDATGEAWLRNAFPAVSVEEVAPGWEDRWKVFHRPVRAGVFWIGPPWEAPPAEAVPVVIDPGRAFGTGAHPTTRLCVEVLPELDGGDLVDVGCGSGVVAIAAAILGFRPVVAVDVDPAAIEATGRNAAANGVAVETFVADGTASGVPSADVAVVNIGLAVVEQVAKRIECDVVVTAGYLDPERPSLPRFAHVRRRVLGGWAADVWTRTARS